MIKVILLLSVFTTLSQFARADERVCTLKGMVCQGCVDIVKDKICGDKYSTCEISVNKAHLVTRVKNQKIDVAELNKVIKATAYTIVSCDAK